MDARNSSWGSLMFSSGRHIDGHYFIAGEEVDFAPIGTPARAEAAFGRPLSFPGHPRGATKAQVNPRVPRWIAYDFDDSGRREIYV